MKALTICQPFAHLIAIGKKRVENRSWGTQCRGPLAIHAGKSRDWLGLNDENCYPSMAYGAIVAVATLTAVLRYGAITQALQARAVYADATGFIPDRLDWVLDHEHTEGPWCWVLTDVRRLDVPVPYRGRRRLFDVDARTSRLIADS